MSDKELLEEFVETKAGPDGVALRVCTISWPEPSNPSPEEIEAARRALLNNTKFFRVCATCHERHPDGWMYDKTLCQSCAERHFGVKY
jgi:hypothetical protein